MLKTSYYRQPTLPPSLVLTQKISVDRKGMIGTLHRRAVSSTADFEFTRSTSEEAPSVTLFVPGAFGYTEDEALLLYLVAIHSGYFLAVPQLCQRQARLPHWLNQKFQGRGRAVRVPPPRNSTLPTLFTPRL
ncbi:MAG: hypothetical protein DMG49_18230 [Acidobacteria bacterium]|nr:MAG: hypothetical protein DMG49_18230 [Acidobacteriota bacterium]